jgi:DedD protein
MDRALIERMVGAVVLVVLLVVVAPALLDGRRDADIDRGADVDGTLRTEVIVLNGRNAESEVSLPAPGEKQIELPPAPATLKVESKPAPTITRKPATPPVSARKPEGYAVQIGSFSRKENADQFAAGLSGEGFSVFVMSAKTTAGTVYRVNAGPRATRADAEKLAAVISQSGRSVMVVELGSANNGVGQ